MAESQAELRMSVGMDVPQVGFDQQVAQTDAPDPEGMRIFSLTGSAKIMRESLSRSLSARAQELDLDADPPQRAVCCKQCGRTERISVYGSVVHHLQTWGRWCLTSMNDLEPPDPTSY
jgi:hypothetical protein